MKVGIGDVVRYLPIGSTEWIYIKIYGVKTGSVYFFLSTPEGKRLNDKVFMKPVREMAGRIAPI